MSYTAPEDAQRPRSLYDIPVHPDFRGIKSRYVEIFPQL